ncbi:MAG: mucoidy inhibitor MuiA family protein [Deltaproteobacteria bacterium]|nr:MAG: mucoidy inhibitor MuiA family protein [Deltaproteobacteria bacterium]
MRALIAVAALTPYLALAATPARAEEPKGVKSKITAVTVYADRAQVTRSGAIELSGAAQRFVVAGLPGWIDEESVRATTSTGRILDVVVERTFLAEASEEAVRKADAAVNEIADQLQAIGDEEAVVRAEIQQLEAVRAFSLDKLPRDMATRETKVATFGETVDYISGTLRRDHKQLRELARQRRTLQPQLQARTQARNELRARAQLEQRDVIVEIDGRGHAKLTLTYLTPGATWEPLGEMRAGSQGSKVTLAQFAQVVQTTGEDWEGATLSFSTQRPAETLNVPEVQSLLLGSAGSGLSEVLGRMGQSFQKAQSTYAAQNESFSQGNADYRANVARQMEIQNRVVSTFETLAQRGTTAHYDALSTRPVRTDGKPIRVPIAHNTFEATPKLVAVPEVSLNAVRTAEIVNTADQPVLPGKVALFVDDAFVGTSEVAFVAPGETFSAYLGVEDRVKLSRTLDRKRSKLDRGSRRTTLKVSFVIEAENLSDVPMTLELGDRVPVIGDDALEIDEVKTPKGSKRDANGVVRWSVTLAPKTSKSWRIEYELEYPNDLLERQQMRKARSPAAAPAPDERVYDDIEQLEQMF